MTVFLIIYGFLQPISFYFSSKGHNTPFSQHRGFFAGALARAETVLRRLTTAIAILSLVPHVRGFILDVIVHGSWLVVKGEILRWGEMFKGTLYSWR